MLRRAVKHPKTRALARALDCDLATARGVLVSLWYVTATQAPQGDIGAFTNDEIAEDMGTRFDPDTLINALINTGWIDRCTEHRLVIHDWAEHCDRATRGMLTRRGERFVTACPPEGNEYHDNMRTTGVHSVRTCGAQDGAPVVRTSRSMKYEVRSQKPEVGSLPSATASAPTDSGSPVTPEQVAEIVDLYPKSVARTKAQRACALRLAEIASKPPPGVREGEGPTQYLKRRVSDYRASQAARELRFVPNPATWFQDRRDEDADEAWNPPDEQGRPKRASVFGTKGKP